MSYLKPCPFCGVDPRIRQTWTTRGDLFFTHCHNNDCLVRPAGIGFITKIASLKAWNTRKQPLKPESIWWWKRDDEHTVGYGYLITRLSAKVWHLTFVAENKSKLKNRDFGHFSTLWRAKNAAHNHHNAKTLKILAEKAKKS